MKTTLALFLPVQSAIRTVASAVNARTPQGLKDAAARIQVHAAGRNENDLTINLDTLRQITDKDGDMVMAWAPHRGADRLVLR